MAALSARNLLQHMRINIGSRRELTNDILKLVMLNSSPNLVSGLPFSNRDETCLPPMPWYSFDEMKPGWAFKTSESFFQAATMSSDLPSGT